jgi:hypothetical protein
LGCSIVWGQAERLILGIHRPHNWIRLNTIKCKRPQIDTYPRQRANFLPGPSSERAVYGLGFDGSERDSMQPNVIRRPLAQSVRFVFDGKEAAPVAF